MPLFVEKIGGGSPVHVHEQEKERASASLSAASFRASVSRKELIKELSTRIKSEREKHVTWTQFEREKVLVYCSAYDDWWSFHNKFGGSRRH